MRTPTEPKDIERFEIGELTFYWNVDENEFKERIKNHRNILIAGFPPVGNTIPYHIKQILKDSEKILNLYSHNFPPIAEVHDEEFEIPHDEIWYSEEKKLFCYVGKYPEINIPKAMYKQAEKVANLSKELGVRELYTTGVIIPSQEPFRNPKGEIEAYVSFFEGSRKEVPEGTKKMTRKNIGRYTIIHKTGLLPGFASRLGIESYSILGVGKYPEDMRACTGALRAFKKLSGLDIETATIEEMFNKSAEAIEERIKEEKERSAAYKGEGIEAGASQYMYG